MLKGIAASAGAAVAQLFYLEEPDLSVVEETGLDPAQQHQRYEQAAAQAIRELDGLYEKARATDENVAQVFDIHRMMLEDPDLIDGIDELLDQGFNAEYAVRQTADGLAAMFKAMEDEYMQARSADITDVGQPADPGTQRAIRIPPSSPRAGNCGGGGICCPARPYGLGQITRGGGIWSSPQLGSSTSTVLRHPGPHPWASLPSWAWGTTYAGCPPIAALVAH